MNTNNVRKIALVTGGSNGIGNAIARRFIAQDVEVVIADIHPPEDDRSGTYRKCDVTRGEEVDSLFAWTMEAYGIPDILVLNAGKGIHERLTEGDPEKWQEVVNLNIMGVLRCIRAFVPAMQQKRRAHVVFISSVAAARPYAYGGVYSATKAAVEAIAETLRMEVLPDISITIIAPGTTDTGFFKGRGDMQSIAGESLSADDIAEDVWYAVNKRAGATINKIVTRPFRQEF